MVSKWSSRMASKWNFGSTQKLTEYSNLVDEEIFEEGIDYMDFWPSSEKENFSSLIDRANIWLRDNPQWKFYTCSNNIRKHNASPNYKIKGGAPGVYFNGLRLWITASEDNESYQQIGYINIIPREIKKGGIFSSPSFERLEQAIDNFNEMIRKHPIPGRIINIESQNTKLTKKGLKPDKLIWTKHERGLTRFVYIIRIFYEIKEASSEEIGIRDFIPSLTSVDGLIFFNLINKASEWCVQQTNIRICNAQFIESKLKNVENDAYVCNAEHSSIRGFLRVLRVAYTKPVSNLCPTLSPPVTRLTCKTFVPTAVSTGEHISRFESLKEMQARVFAFIKEIGVQVINIQISYTKLSKGGTLFYANDTCFYTGGYSDEYWFYVIRVFLNGHYLDPEEETIPALRIKKYQLEEIP